MTDDDEMKEWAERIKRMGIEDAKETEPAPSSAFFIRRATPPTRSKVTGKYGARTFEVPGAPATIMVCGIEWTSRIPRTQSECEQTNTWAERIIAQNSK